jgi:hypothetical protein
MKILLKVSFLFFLFIAAPAFSQDNTTASESKKNDVESRKLKRKKDKAAWKAKREKEQGDKKAVRNHEKRLQTKATRKRMKKDRHKAALNNAHKKEFFLIRWFKPKPRV